MNDIRKILQAALKKAGLKTAVIIDDAYQAFPADKSFNHAYAPLTNLIHEDRDVVAAAELITGVPLAGDDDVDSFLVNEQALRKLWYSREDGPASAVWNILFAEIALSTKSNAAQLQPLENFLNDAGLEVQKIPPGEDPRHLDRPDLVCIDLYLDSVDRTPDSAAQLAGEMYNTFFDAMGFQNPEGPLVVLISSQGRDLPAKFRPGAKVHQSRFTYVPKQAFGDGSEQYNLCRLVKLIEFSERSGSYVRKVTEFLKLYRETLTDFEESMKEISAADLEMVARNLLFEEKISPSEYLSDIICSQVLTRAQNVAHVFDGLEQIGNEVGRPPLLTLSDAHFRMYRDSIFTPGSAINYQGQQLDFSALRMGDVLQSSQVNDCGDVEKCRHHPSSDIMLVISQDCDVIRSSTPFVSRGPSDHVYLVPAVKQGHKLYASAAMGIYPFIVGGSSFAIKWDYKEWMIVRSWEFDDFIAVHGYTRMCRLRAPWAFKAQKELFEHQTRVAVPVGVDTIWPVAKIRFDGKGEDDEAIVLFEIDVPDGAAITHARHGTTMGNNFVMTEPLVFDHVIPRLIEAIQEPSVSDQTRQAVKSIVTNSDSIGALQTGWFFEEKKERDNATKANVAKLPKVEFKITSSPDDATVKFANRKSALRMVVMRT